MKEPMTLYMVVPCYNEEAVLPETAKQLGGKIASLIRDGKISRKSRITFVNDGSTDGTWELISQLCAGKGARLFCGIDLAHNAGHQAAVLAGLMTVRDRCDAAITMDADLQDDVEAIESMVDACLAGNEVVYGVRSSRKTDSWFKRQTAEGFYKFMKLMGTEVVFNHADFRLMSRRVLEELSHFPESNLFLRGMIPLIGFRSTKVYYERRERFAGESKYPLRKMLHFAAEGITSFSVKPLKIITNLGFLMVLVSVGMVLWAFFTKLTGHSEQGWSSTVCSIWFIGGIQTLCLGIIGEYIGKIYAEVKHRPRYIVAEFLHGEEEK
ncbi:MAG: glycosyltransferase family 2 protein [Oscillospiraceae bacterium]|nr:glycosyltransferase family 2 protein [Oscillospiraceae bacterium]